MTKWIMICLLAVALAPVGCGKKAQGPESQPQAISIDVPKLRDAFSNANPDLKQMSSEAIRAIAGANYGVAVPAMEKLAAAPGLTDAQKQAVEEVMAQVKQMAARAAAPPSQ